MEKAKVRIHIRLTKKEKDDVVRAVSAPSNLRTINKIQSILK